MMSLSRRQFLKLLGGLGIVACSGDAFFLEPYRISLSRQILPADGDNHPGPVLRLVQLSDLHLRRFGGFEERLIGAVNTLHPDLIVITGDSFNRPEDAVLFDRFVAALPAGVPVYGVPGNWEYSAELDLQEMDRLFRRKGGRLLVNESVRLSHDGAELLLTGLDSLIGGLPDLSRSLHGQSPAVNHMLLAHCPGYLDILPDQLAGLPGFHPQYLLAGHTHGGQLTLFGLAPFLPAGSGGYRHGWYDGAGVRIYVSRGIGTTAIPVRFMAPPEIVLYEWRLESSPGDQSGSGNR